MFQAARFRATMSALQEDEIQMLSENEVSPEERKSQHFQPNGRTFSADSGFVSPETICRPKLSASRRSSPGNDNHPITSFRLEDSAESCHLSEKELPSKAIADLWNKPLKFSGPLSTKTPRNVLLCSEGSNTPNRWNELPPTKLSFDSCESSADETSPPPPPAVNQARKGLGYRRSLSYTEPDLSKKEPFNYLASDGTPVFQAKRHKFQNDESSPYKTYLSQPTKTIDNENSENIEPKASSGTSSLTPEVKRLTFFRSQSESALTPCSVKNALERIESNPNLIGDGTKSYILPFKINGKHPDLKEISRDTLSELLEGKVHANVTSFKVIDCRYPYEFEGGHIKGAINLFTKKQIYENLLQPKALGKHEMGHEERNILIFHCEFSSQRGPDMCRYLRDTDRETNSARYPFLYYPELYVLYGGYKAFYEQFPTLCEPQTYLPMDHPNHLEDCRRFKSRTKLEYPTEFNNRSKKSKSQNKFYRAASFAKKCNF